MSDRQENNNYAAAHDDYALTPVPEHSRRGLLSMSAVMLGFTFFAASMWTGGTLGQGFRLWPDLIIVILAGNLILGAYGALLGYAAAKTNLSTHILARYAFGSLGSKLPSMMLAITQIGWFGVGVAMFAYPINKFMDIPNLPLILGGGIVMTYTVVVGFKAIEWLSAIAVPAILILGFTSVATAISDTEGGLDTLMSLNPAQSMSMAVGIALAVGSFISGATLTPDFVRYARNRRVGVIATLIGFTFGNSLMFVFGAVGATATGMADIAEVLAYQGLLGAGIALLVLNIWTTNDNALYAAGLGLTNITGLKRVHLVLAAGAVGTLLADFLYNNFVSWLVFLSVSLPPIGGIIIGDFYLRCKAHYPAPAGCDFKRINWAAMAAWACAICVSVLSPDDGLFSIAPLNAILTAMVAQVLFYKVIYRKDAAALGSAARS
ncbi:cytosine permease [Marinobacterium rhizophilum]|uniref:Cytosine permease n=1 Tax=Marinobacterium rhizophilum TaxID=420402 RepID=A0ABY5HJE2_9GAMM|nr:cytosine permease [Marinobacterium rhizophilum]UTW11387.1 cytosine permease [Marinobacterium rhizophilum]